MSDNLVTWYRAQLDEDERVALAAQPGGWSYDRETFTVRGGRWEVASRRRSTYECGTTDPILDVDGTHIARHNPARVLREVAAKRAILNLHEGNRFGACETCMDTEPLAAGDCGGASAPCDTLRHLAAVHADRPGYREEWRP